MPEERISVYTRQSETPRTFCQLNELNTTERAETKLSILSALLPDSDIAFTLMDGLHRLKREREREREREGQGSKGSMCDRVREGE